MKALSIRQPWAWLIVNGYKDIENRSWSTELRGKVMVHAGKSIDWEGWHLVRRHFPQIPIPWEFETGGIVGSVEITGCTNQSDSPWFEGKFGFVLKNGKPCEFKPCRGMLKFFEVEE